MRTTKRDKVILRFHSMEFLINIFRRIIQSVQHLRSLSRSRQRSPSTRNEVTQPERRSSRSPSSLLCFRFLVNYGYFCYLIVVSRQGEYSCFDTKLVLRFARFLWAAEKYEGIQWLLYIFWRRQKWSSKVEEGGWVSNSTEGTHPLLDFY